MNSEKQIETTDWLTKDYSKEELARIKAEAVKEANLELRDRQIKEMAKDINLAALENCSGNCLGCKYKKNGNRRLYLR